MCPDADADADADADGGHKKDSQRTGKDSVWSWLNGRRG